MRNTGAAKLPTQPLLRARRITPQKLHLKRELRREESCSGLVPRYATVARQLIVVKCTCKRHRVLQCRFGRGEKSNAGALLTKKVRFLNI